MESQHLEQEIKLAAKYHQQGSFQEAELRYREILKIEKNNPIANHNLGMIALQFGKCAAASSLFKVAVENDSSQVQFWISYIESLLYGGLIKDAEHVYAQGIANGINGESYSLLGERIKTPKSELIEKLMMLYKRGKYAAAERCANAILVKYPHYGLGWKILGACLSRIGKENEAIKAKYVATSLMPIDAEAHNNLGNSLLNAKQYEKAANSFQVSLRLQPNNAVILNKMGVCLQQIHQYELAKKYYLESIRIRKENFEAYKNIGNIYMLTREYKSAEKYYISAIKINDKYAEGYNNLGAAYFAQGEINLAKEVYGLASKLDAKSSGYLHNLGMANYFLGNFDDAYRNFKKNINNFTDQWVLESAVYLIVSHYLRGEIDDCLRLITRYEIKSNLSIAKVFNYIPYLRLLIEFKNNHSQFKNQNDNKLNKLYVIGESHSLSAQDLEIKIEDKTYRGVSKWIIGCKQWHLSNDKKNQYKFAFNSILSNIPQNSLILLTIGEIDCRPDEGVQRALQKQSHQTIEEHVKALVNSYVQYVSEIVKIKKHKIIMCGIPATNIPIDNLNIETAKKLIRIIRAMNIEIEREAIKNGFGFLDVFSLTDRGDGISTSEWHIDDVHLKPSAFCEAFSRIKVMPLK